MLYKAKSGWPCRLVLLGLGFVLALPLAAQDSRDGGSLYSYFGLGELYRFPSSQITAMGGGGVAVQSYNYINFSNPAAWSDQILVRAAASALYQNTSISDAAGNSSRVNVGGLGAIQFSFPILSRKLGFAFAFQPFSRVSYRILQRGALVVDGEQSDTGTPYEVYFEGTGGLQQITGGLGYRLNDHVSVGASVSYVFGLIENIRRTSFPTDNTLAETNLSLSTREWGLTGTFGVLTTLPRVLGQEDLLNVGATVTLPTSLSGRRALTLGRSLDRDTLGTVLRGSTDLPMGVNLGAAYQPDPRWLITVNAGYEPWSTFESEFEYPGYMPGDESQFQDRYRLSGGAEWVPAGDDQLASYFGRVGYRLGLYYDQAYVTPAEGVSLNTIAATGGLSLPTMLPGTRIDLNLEVGTRGSTEQNMVRDVFYRVSFSVNIGERWFVKRKLR
jgi:hypothetical protein